MASYGRDTDDDGLNGLIIDRKGKRNEKSSVYNALCWR
jgi:hypothetical protein